MNSDLINEVLSKSKELDERIRQLAKWGRQKAQTEYEYKMELTKEVFKLKEEGNPATLISLIVHGQPNVAKKRLDRDVAEAMYESCMESINVMKLQTRIIENQASREYGNTK